MQTSSVHWLPSSAQAVFGLHTPPQVPFEHVKGQAAPSWSHAPWGEQVWMPPAWPHFWVPGTHSPPQVPAEQRNGHWVPLVHSLLVQVWGTLPEHCLVPLVQAPPQLAVLPEKLQENAQASVVAQ